MPSNTAPVEPRDTKSAPASDENRTTNRAGARSSSPSAVKTEMAATDVDVLMMFWKGGATDGEEGNNDQDLSGVF